MEGACKARVKSMKRVHKKEGAIKEVSGQEENFRSRQK